MLAKVAVKVQQMFVRHAEQYSVVPFECYLCMMARPILMCAGLDLLLVAACCCCCCCCLQEIVSIYPLLSPPALTAHASNRVCNALALLQCVASHPETRGLFLQGELEGQDSVALAATLVTYARCIVLQQNSSCCCSCPLYRHNRAHWLLTKEGSSTCVVRDL
jgi:hypothetical protein